MGVVLAAIAVLGLLAVPPATARQSSSGQDQAQQDPAARVEVVTVTATRLPARVSDLPTVARAWDAGELQRAPAIVLDDALRSAPSVGLFRRTSSRDSHPTSQGLNLRGIAPSGVSRALVLVDGVPMNDPFGGWVYWDRVPLLALEQVEVALGGGSAPYGSQALGGVLQLVTRRRMASDLEIQALGGTDSTVRFGVATGASGAAGSLFASAQLFNTAGYVATAPEERGSIDTEVAANSQAARVRYDTTNGVSINVEALSESRGNGTPLQTNETTLTGASGAWQGVNAAGDFGWRAHGFARSQEFQSNFTAVADDRNSERLTLRQRVPTNDYGLGGHGWKATGRSTVSFGADWRRVNGQSNETVIFSGATRAPGGIQHLGGAFASGDWRPDDSISIGFGLRADGWHQTPLEVDAEERSATTLSPRAGVAWHPRPDVTVRGAAYRAFRAPTLNELYRQFRVGNVITAANAELDEERLRGAEVGAGWSGELQQGRSRLSVDSTFYWNRLQDAIINATDRVTETLIFRRRENLGAATARGVELDARWELDGRWTFAASYAWLDSRIDEAGGIDPANVDNRLPQVPTYRARASFGYRDPRGWSGLLSVGSVGEQFEDDRNDLRLAPATVLDAAIEVPLLDTAHLTLRAENLLDKDVEAKRTPTLAFAAPRLVYAGITLSFPDR